MSDFIAALLSAPLLLLIYFVTGLIVFKLGRGYNSLGRAMASREAQTFAARYAGASFMKLSAIAFVPVTALSVASFILRENETLHNILFWVSFAIAMIIPVIVIVLTELTLRKHFDKEGRRY